MNSAHVYLTRSLLMKALRGKKALRQLYEFANLSKPTQKNPPRWHRNAQCLTPKCVNHIAVWRWGSRSVNGMYIIWCSSLQTQLGSKQNHSSCIFVLWCIGCFNNVCLVCAQGVYKNKPDIVLFLETRNQQGMGNISPRRGGHTDVETSHTYGNILSIL